MDRSQKLQVGRLALRARHRLTRLKYNPTALLAVIIVVLLIYLVLGPLLSILTEAFVVHSRDAGRIGQPTGSFTWHYLNRVFSSAVSVVFFWQPLLRTIITSLAIVVGAVGLGFILAWILVRTDCPGRSFYSKVLILSYVAPSWTFALAWTTIFKNRRVAGSFGLLESLGFTPPDWIAYGGVPIVVTLVLSYFPLAFLLFGGALQTVDAQLEESARVVGAPRGIILRRIVLPLLLPALMSSGLLILSRSLGSFGTPYILGAPTDFQVLATSLYGAINRGEQGIAGILTVVIVLLGVGAVSIDVFFVKEARRFVTISGKGGSKTIMQLGKFKLPAFLFVGFIFAVSVVLPLAALFLSTITHRVGVFTLDNFTLQYWIGETIPRLGGRGGIFRDPVILRAALNSLRVSIAAALLAGVFGTFIGYVTTKYQHTKLGMFLKQISFLPWLVPTIGFSAAYLSLFAVQRGPVPSLYGSVSLIILAMSIKYLPFSARAGTSAMIQLGPEPEESAMICGATWSKSFRKIVIPVLKKTLAVGIVLPFVMGMKELTLVIFLVSPGHEVLTTQVLRYIDYGFTPMANAVTVVIIVVISVVYLLFQKITGTSLVKGLSSS